jgi:adenine phosphoribosyltransferase
MDLSGRIKSTIREIQDFPRKGISFKDITPLLGEPALSGEITSALLAPFSINPPDVIVGIESRGFLYGMLMSQKLGIPFVPVRKQGKLPGDTLSHGYQLEYGEAVLEIHTDSIKKGAHVLIHDDLLATGGTCEATAILVNKLGAKVAGFSFLVELTELKGRTRLLPYTDTIHTLVSY